MSIKKLLLLSYILTGFIISIFTAFMTFYIIDVPIGMKMFSKIVITITLTLPIITFLSYFLGTYFSKKFVFIKDRLINIADKDFQIYDEDERINEIDDIHKTLNLVSLELATSIKELKEKNSELTWMVRSFAHDFRTPLTIISGNIEAIEDGLVSQKNLPATLEKIKHETTYMNELLSEVLCFISSMKSSVKKEKILLREFIEKEVFVLLEPLDKGQLVNETQENDTIEFTKTDLKKILINLLSNSIKFTTKGTITVCFENNILIVKDTGIGVDIQECEKIFQAFYTVDTSKNRLKSGFGLGLAIAKNLAQKNDYLLQCDSQYQNGCKIAIISL